jgi:hypothetical protein
LDVIYGSPSFNLDASTNNTETPITYSVDPSGVVSVDASGNVTILGKGTDTSIISNYLSEKIPKK